MGDGADPVDVDLRAGCGRRPGTSATTSVEKAFALLSAVAEQHDAVRLSDLADAVELPKSTAHRLLRTLEDAGFIGRRGTRYELGDRFYVLSEAAKWSRYGALRERAQEPLADLFDRGGAAVHLAVLDGAEVLYLEKLTGRDGVRVPTRVGSRMPATCTSLGKALLAFAPPSEIRAILAAPLPRITAYSVVDPRRMNDELREVRATGVAYEHEEGRLGVSCVASPIQVDGATLAAVSVSYSGGTPSTSDALLVRDAARRIASNVRPYLAS